MREELAAEGREAKSLRDRLAEVERELEFALGSQNQQNRQRCSPAAYLKSSPESSLADKSESELSKKLVSRTCFPDRDFGGDDPSGKSRPLPNCRYKHVG